MAKRSTEPLSPDHEIIAAHIAATRAAFQVMVSCLQRNGALERGEYQEMLRVYMESVKSSGDPTMLALLHDLRFVLDGLVNHACPMTPPLSHRLETAGRHLPALPISLQLVTHFLTLAEIAEAGALDR